MPRVQLGKGIGFDLAGVEVPALDAAQAGKHDPAGRMLDAGVDQEENLAVSKLAAVMEQDALVARSALDRGSRPSSGRSGGRLRWR